MKRFKNTMTSQISTNYKKILYTCSCGWEWGKTFEIRQKLILTNKKIYM